jgi:hypothetical protein
MDGGLENTWLVDFGCSRHMNENKKWFSILTPLSHKEYVIFGDDKKGKVLCTGVIKVNDCFILNDVALLNKLSYNLFSFSQLVDADWMCFLTNLVLVLLILLASLCVTFLILERFFKLISHLLNLL